eukprot:TRINITY_DN26198_c0_g1_i1.p1 TRINITY_DN26198_c0_g1~~TRINITY_DN26198_c0_g1_i1.p1  ORF type:complete len:221 (+),score=91.13 TRINITY_DN26198_c0_g1_i1:60-722(+)
MRLFGKAKKAPSVAESINKLKETLDLLEKREDHLNKKVQTELKNAKLNATKNRKAALMALKRKKQYEQQIEKIQGARLTIEQQMMTIENASVNLEAMNAMRYGANAMRQIHNSMTVEQVDDTMDEIREQMEVANEISEAISQPIGGMELFDEDELEEELAMLEEESLDAQLLNVQQVPQQQQQVPAGVQPEQQIHLPSVPQNQLSQEEKELAELEASMAW